jgi:heptosyltransferase-1
MAQLLYNEWVTARASAAHISEKYLLVASSLGAGSNKPPMTITFGQADQAASDRLLASVRASGSPDYPLAAFCPSASRTHKLWPPERYAQVANWVSGNLEMLPLFLGGKGDAVYVEEIREACQCPTASLAGQTSLKEAAALLAESRLVIGADTALTHIGAALRRPVVALFGVAGIDYQPRGPLTEVVRSDCRCAPCWARGECAVDYECMLGIQVEQVVGAIRRLVCSSG